MTAVRKLPFLLVLFLSYSAQAADAIPGAKNPAPRQTQRVADYGKLPLAFEANQGQTDSRVEFLSRGSGYTLFLTPGGAVLELRAGRPQDRQSDAGATSVVRMDLAGANSKAQVTGLDELPGKANYFIGNDPHRWRTNVPTYARVKYAGVYPDVDLVYYGTRGQIEYDFVVAPGGDPQRIVLGFEGAKLKLDAHGDLLLGTSESDVRFRKPVMYQTVNGSRKSVDGHYVLSSDNRVSFEVGDYDHSRALVIDPALAYLTYLGGTAQDYGYGIAVDTAGNAYVTGTTTSADFPVKNPIEPYHTGDHGFDVFVTKMNATGTALVYSTFLGGTDDDKGFGIAVDGAGNAYVAGYTASNDFPTTPNVLREVCGELLVNGIPTGTCTFLAPDGFVTKLNPAGSALVYSTFLGGTGNDEADAIAVDPAGEAYVAGRTAGTLPTGNPNDPGFPLSPSAFQGTHPGGFFTTFFVKLNTTASLEVYGSLLGSPTGVTHSYARGVAVDSSGKAYVGGYTGAADFPTTAGAFQTTCSPVVNGGCFGTRGFAAKFDPSLSDVASLVYSTYLGGTTNATYEIHAIAVDKTGSAYAAGIATWTDFPTTSGAFQTACNTGGGSCHAGFVTKFNPTGTALAYSTFLGNQLGSHNTVGEASGIQVDTAKNAYVTGEVGELAPNPPQDFPLVNPTQPIFGGATDYFISKFNAAGKALLFSTYLGGQGYDQVPKIAVDSKGSIYVTGFTGSNNLPVTPGAFQTVFKANPISSFVAKIALTAADMAITNSAPADVNSGNNLTYTIVATNNGPDSASTVQVSDKTPAGTTFVSVATTAGTCTAPAPGGTGKVNCKVASRANGANMTVTLVLKVTAAPGSNISDTASVSAKTFDPNPANNSAKASTAVH